MDSQDASRKKDTCNAHSGCGHAHGHPVDMKRRGAVRTSLTALLGGVTAMVVGGLGTKKAHAGAGKCWKCECRAFEGTGDLCTNCGHQYADHN
jgi:hypothetical protein